MAPDLKLAVEIAVTAAECPPEANTEDMRAKAKELARRHPESDAEPDDIAEALSEEISSRR